MEIRFTKILKYIFQKNFLIDLMGQYRQNQKIFKKFIFHLSLEYFLKVIFFISNMTIENFIKI